MACWIGTVLYFIFCCNCLVSATPQDTNTSSSYLPIRPDVCYGPKWSCVGACGQFRSMPCSCDDRCPVYNNCCEDYLFVCSPPDNRNVSMFHKAHTVCLWNDLLLIAQCPATASNRTDVKRCLQYQENFEDLVPVTDTRLGLHFRNSACARCNGLNDIVRWGANMSCKVDLPVNPENAFHFIKTKRCDVNFYAPVVEGVHLPMAVRCVMTGSRYCNIKAYSSMCGAFASYVKMKNTKMIFYNRFCLLCRGVESADCEIPEMDISEGYYGASQFSSLMNWVPADGTWAITNTFQHKSATRSCSVGSGTASSVCKITSCPEGSVPFLNNTYCLSDPTFPVFVSGAVDDALPSDFTPPNKRDNTVAGCTSVRSFDTFVRHLVYRFECNWGTTRTHATIQQMKQLYDAIVDMLRNNNVRYRITNMTTVFISVHKQLITETEATYIPPDDQTWLKAIEWTLSVIFTSLSITCLGVRVLLQPFSYLLHTHPGSMQFCLCGCLLMAYSLFLVSQTAAANSRYCWVTSLLLHWAFLSSLFWMHAITYDLWSRFRYGRILSSMRERRSLKKVSIYCCLSPSLIVGTACILDILYPSSIFSPMYGASLCWINQSNALIVFFVVPVSLLCAMNLVFIVVTFRNLHAHYKSSKFINSLSTSSPILSISICTKMTCLTGATWLVGLLAGFVNNSFLWVAFTVINSSCGLMVGMTLMWNRRLWGSLTLPGKRRVCIRASVTPSRGRRVPMYSVSTDTKSNSSTSGTPYVSVTSCTQHVSVTPSTQHVSATPSTQHVSATPSTQHVSATPSTQHVSATPSTQHVSATPSTQHVSATPSTQHVSVTSYTQHVSVTSSTQHVSVIPSTQHASATPSTQHM